VILLIELSVRDRVILHLVGQKAQELSCHDFLDAADQVAVLSLLAGQGQRKVLAIHGTLQESETGRP